MKGFDTTVLKKSALIALLCVFVVPAFAAGQKLVIDPYHTQVYFTWNHVGFSNPGATANVSEGVLIWGEGEPSQSSVSVTIPVESIDTQLPVLNALFQSKFFEAKKYPTITFESTGVQRIGLSNHYQVEGKLTIHGVTKPVTLDATLNNSGELPMLKTPAVGFDATTTVQRSAFGLKEYLPLVGNRVRIHISAAAITPEALAQEKQMVQKVLNKLKTSTDTK